MASNSGPTSSNEDCGMTKTQFTGFLAEKHGFTVPYAEKILNAFLDSIEDALFRDGHLQLRGLGVFEVRDVPEKQCRNPATGEPVTVPACRAVRFRPGKAIRDFLD